MKPAITIFVAFLVAACGSAPPHAHQDPSNAASSAVTAPSLAGQYRTTHTIRMVCEQMKDGWCDEQAEDTMTIRDATAGALAVTIELVRTNGHSCSFDGELASVRAHVWQFQGEDPEGKCLLVLEQKTDHDIEIRSDGCRSYCGIRASLDASFARP